MKRENENLDPENNEVRIDTTTELLPPVRILFIAGWFGLLAGLLEGIYLVGWRHFFKGYRIYLSPHALWMAPVGEMLFFIFLGIFLAILFWRLPRIFTARVIYFILALLSFLALLFLHSQLHLIAQWALAAGLAAQASRLIDKHQKGFYRLVRTTSGGLVALVIAVAVGIFVWQSVAYRRALAKLPPASASNPNVILITLDTVRARNLSLYGYERKTSPELEKLAEKSAVFEQAIAPSSWTFPSHASMFTGRRPFELKATWTGSLDGTYRTLAEELASRGYESAGFVANYQYCSSEIKINRGMTHYEDYPVSAGQMLYSASLWRAIFTNPEFRQVVHYDDSLNRKSAEMLNEEFLDWLSSRGKNRPFFAFLNYFDAHEPLVPPEPFDERFGPARNPTTMISYSNGDVFSDFRNFSEDDTKRFRNAYDGSIAYLDHQIGRLFAKLSESGMLDNTLVIITSDHGEQLGEKGLFGHGNSLYVRTLRVPLLIRFPSRIPRGVRIQEPVTLRDIPATILDFLADGNQKVFPGKSLARYLTEEEKRSVSDQQTGVTSELLESAWVEKWYPVSKGDMQSIVNNQYHYILNGDGSEELYDRKTDLDEVHNLVQTPEVNAVLVRFRDELKEQRLRE